MMGKIFGIVLVFVMVGVMLGGLPGTTFPLSNLHNTAHASSLAGGQGIWIWKIWELGESVNQIINKLESAGVEWVTVKCGDSDSYYLSPGKLMYNWLITSGYSDFSEVVTQFHNAGIKVFGWHYVYSYDCWDVSGVTEADVSNQILDISGIDGLIIDAEAEYEGQGKGEIAENYMIDIRNEHPSSFIAYSTFPIIDYHLWFPYIEFGRYCDAVMPQAYWKDLGVTPTEMVNWMNEQWDKWHDTWESSGYGDSVKPLIPVGQGDVSGDEITEFCEVVFSRYEGVSLWRYGIMTSEAWSAYATIGGADTTPPTVDTLSVAPDSVTLGNPFTIYYTVSDTGGSGLDWVELWRQYETETWVEIDSHILSGVGNGPHSSSFSDAPSSVGTYVYGIHVGDGAGKWVTERDSGLFPIEVEVTPEIYPPQVATNAATNVEETTAILNGVISDDGGEACQYRFEYNTNPGEPYAYNTGWTGSKTNGQSFSQAISSLNKGTKYYFRAQARNSAGAASGAEQTFLTKPDAPTSFNASAAGTTQINLSWAKGDGSQKTKIQRKEGGYPVDRNDGTQVYFGTGTSTPDIGLTPGTTYYYRAWSYVQGSEQWSDSYAQASATTVSAPPSVTSVAPNFGNQGQMLDVTITGNNFTGAIAVSFGADITVTSFTVGSNTQITANIIIDVSASPGARDVSVTTSAGTGTLTDGFTVTEVEIQLSLKAGWNMVSVPVTPQDTSAASVFAGTEVVYTWNPTTKSYYPPTEVEPDKGYFVAVLSDMDILVSGVPVYNWTTDITAGWNMSGSVFDTVSFTDPQDNPDGSVEAFAFWWNPVTKSYDLVTTIDTKKGHWIAATQNCTLNLSAP